MFVTLCCYTKLRLKGIAVSEDVGIGMFFAGCGELFLYLTTIGYLLG